MKLFSTFIPQDFEYLFEDLDGLKWNLLEGDRDAEIIRLFAMAFLFLHEETKLESSREGGDCYGELADMGFRYLVYNQPDRLLSYIQAATCRLKAYSDPAGAIFHLKAAEHLLNLNYKEEQGLWKVDYEWNKEIPSELGISVVYDLLAMMCYSYFIATDIGEGKRYLRRVLSLLQDRQYFQVSLWPLNDLSSIVSVESIQDIVVLQMQLSESDANAAESLKDFLYRAGLLK